MDDERVRSFERDLWTGSEEVYRERVSENCLMVLPAEPFVLSGEAAVAAVADTPRWSHVDFSDFRISRPQEGLIVIAYKADADRNGQAYEAYCTSTYQRLGQEEWQVIQHQQTVVLRSQ